MALSHQGWSTSHTLFKHGKRGTDVCSDTKGPGNRKLNGKPKQLSRKDAPPRGGGHCCPSGAAWWCLPHSVSFQPLLCPNDWQHARPLSLSFTFSD